MRITLTFGLCACFLTSGISRAETLTNEATIGVLAYRGSAELKQKWMPLSEYLMAVIPGWSFQIVPMTLSSATEQIKSGQLDFVVTNPGHFVTLNREHRMSVLASRSQEKSDERHSTEFGSAIITRKDSGIQSLSDVAGRSVTAIDANAFGGFQIAWYEFDRTGIDLFSDTSSLTFVGFPMDQVVAQVLAKETDVGIVRSGLMEDMLHEGRVDKDEIRFLNTNVIYDHPDTVSTNLYPEWPFAALAATDPNLKTQFAVGLLQSGNSPLAAEYGMNDLWSAPLPYHGVQDLTEAFHARLQHTSLLQSTLFAKAVSVGLLVLLSAGALLWWWRANHAAKELDEVGDVMADEAANLTQREHEILAFIAKGYSTKEIAIDLGISPKTVEFHRANLLRKFGARTSSQLVALAT
ncbi:PhnD/SsuA/transferrin family substrate-binding protein [uncultured Sulfitobacter sp.]|uniref:PhnD/SsuA/transferrin family substrate-binding protein n=1 Tax=uncultured Sulfitobacter sp. TaxID=191468 RepID=UPI00261BDC67|nr:PhnD/SsuA/transferrin family substrate-binding protein [uncultured Sulfitobacter sp.]